MSTLPSVMPRLRAGSSGAERIDRLGWTAGTCIDTYGVRVGIRFNESELLARLEPHLPPAWQPARSPVVDRLFSLWVNPRGEGLVRVYDGSRRRARTASLAEAFATLESEIRQGVAAATRDKVFVHAGVVGWKGRAIVVPGRSRSGKTTLVAELVRAGAEYYSDEFAVLDDDGRVHPFLKPLSVRGPGGCDLHARRQSVEEIGGVSGREPLRVGQVVLAEYGEGAEWNPDRVSPGQAVLEMMAHTVPARLRPEASLNALERAVSGASVWKGRRGEASELARRLLETGEKRA